MNRLQHIGLWACVLPLVAALGYWGGHSSRPQPTAPAQTSPSATAPKILYYRNPMGLADTSPVPKKDPMGMDYVPVYAGDENVASAPANRIQISPDKIQKLGVRTETAELRSLARVVRAAGRVEADERRLSAIAPKFEGYVERLYANATGQMVDKGQALFEVYSPELVSAQREYAIAAQGLATLKGADVSAREGMQQLVDSSLLRLKNWDISAEEVKALAQSGEVRRTLTFRSPVSGIITTKTALQGMRFMPGGTLYQLADLSVVWVIAEVFEQDIALIKAGAQAQVRLNAYPDRVFEGKISYVYPSLSAATRTVPVRIELPNPGLRLKPAMFAAVELPVADQTPVLTVPVSAVIDSGTRQIVLVEAAAGRFEPRKVELGQRSEEYVEIKTGVSAGEKVVVSANFLIDAESNLKAAISAFGGSNNKPSNPGPSPGKTAPAPAVHLAEGSLEALDPQTATLTIAHKPITGLKWPAMSMDFEVTSPALLQGLKPGMAVRFELIENQSGDWVIRAITPMNAPHPATHSGH